MEAINFFKHGAFHDKKPYIRDLYLGHGVSYNGFKFYKETWCWTVWKNTDIGSNPEYKREPLYKVIPNTVPARNIPAVLDAQPWTYI